MDDTVDAEAGRVEASEAGAMDEPRLGESRHSASAEPPAPHRRGSPAEDELVAAGRTNWQRVRIEFEHRSRNFRDHHHDPAGCDLVICWKHDWDECPLEVLDISAELHRLSEQGD